MQLIENEGSKNIHQLVLSQSDLRAFGSPRVTENLGDLRDRLVGYSQRRSRLGEIESALGLREKIDPFREFSIAFNLKMLLSRFLMLLLVQMALFCAVLLATYVLS